MIFRPRRVLWHRVYAAAALLFALALSTGAGLTLWCGGVTIEDCEASAAIHALEYELAETRARLAALEQQQAFDKLGESRITIQFSEANIRTVLEVLASYQDTAILMPEELDGTVSLDLVDVPWTHAVKMLVESVGPYGVVAEDDGLRIVRRD